MGSQRIGYNWVPNIFSDTFSSAFSKVSLVFLCAPGIAILFSCQSTRLDWPRIEHRLSLYLTYHTCPIWKWMDSWSNCVCFEIFHRIFDNVSLNNTFLESQGCFYWKFLTYLFTWLHQFSAMACGIFKLCCGKQTFSGTFSCRVWDHFISAWGNL